MPLPNLSDSQRLGLLQGVIHTMDDGVLVVDREFNILLANRWVEKRQANKMPPAVQKCYSVLFGREDTCPACPFLGSLRTGNPQRQMVRPSTNDDGATWLELCAYPLRDSAGTIVGAIEHVKDVTSRERMDEQLREEMTRRQIFADLSPDGVVVLDLSGQVREANEPFARMLGYTMEEIRQLHIWDWDTQSDKGRLLYMLETAEAIRDHFETSYRRKDGTMVQVEVYSRGTRIADRSLIFHLCRDISEKKAMQKQIREFGVRDPLTDVYMGRYIFERITQISAEHRRGGGEFCISILAIDNFKAVNDVHGNKAGDQALKELAHTINSAVRPYDLVGRYGNEAFLLVSRNATGLETIAMIERITKMVRDSVFAFEGHKIRFTLSCGLAHSSEFPNDAFSADAMVSRAELRLNEAIATGRDRYVGPPSDAGLAPDA